MADLSAEEAEFIELSVGTALHRNKLGHGGSKRVRHVRTPAGAQFYGLPIGAVITTDIINKKNAEHAAQGLTPPSGALTPEKAQAILPGQVVNKAAGNGPNLPGKGGGKNGTPGGGGPGAPGNGSGGGKGNGPSLPGAAGADEPDVPKVTTFKSTLKGPNKFTTGGVEYSAPKDSRIFRPNTHPDAMAYVLEPNGKLHAFTQNGELQIPPIVDKILTEKFGKGFTGDDHYLEDAFESGAPDLASETKAGDVLSDASGPQFTQTANGDWQHNQLGSLHDHADLQKHVDSGDLTMGVGSNKTEDGPSLAEMDKPALKKFLKKLPEGQHLEHTDKGGKVTQIVKSPEGGFVTSKGEPVGDGTLFLLRDKLSVVNDADSPIKGASKKKLDKLKDKLAAPAKPKAEKLKGEKPKLIIEDEFQADVSEKKVPEAAKPEAKAVEKIEPKPVEPKPVEKAVEKKASSAPTPPNADEVDGYLDELDTMLKAGDANKSDLDAAYHFIESGDLSSGIKKSLKNELLGSAKEHGIDDWEMPSSKSEVAKKEEPKKPDIKVGDILNKDNISDAPDRTVVWQVKDGKNYERWMKSGDHWVNALSKYGDHKYNFGTKIRSDAGLLSPGHEIKVEDFHDPDSVDAPKVDAPKVDAPKAEVAKVEELKAPEVAEPAVGKSIKSVDELNALKEGAQVSILHQESGDEKGLFTKTDGAWHDEKGTKADALIKAFAKPAGSNGLVVKKQGGDAPEANTPDVPNDPPVEEPKVEEPEGPKYPAGTKLTSLTQLRDLKPGARVLAKYNQPSGSGTFVSENTFTKGEDGAFHHDGGNFKAMSPDKLKENYASSNHELSVVEDAEGGHGDAVHMGDPITPAYLDGAQDGDSVDIMTTSGGTPSVDKHLIKQPDGMWQSDDGLHAMSKLGLLNEQWHTNVGVKHDLTPAAKPDETDAALAEGDDLINEIQNDSSADPIEAAVAELAPEDHAASFKALQVGDPIKNVEQLDAAPLGSGIHYHKQDGDLTLWNKIPEDENGKDWLHGDGTKVKGKHLANSLKNDPNKLTLAHHAEEKAVEPAAAPVALEPNKQYEPGDIPNAKIGDKLHYPADEGYPAGHWEKTAAHTWTNSNNGSVLTDSELANTFSTDGNEDDVWNKPDDAIDHSDPIEHAIAAVEPKPLQVGDIVSHESQMLPGDIYQHTETGQKMVVNPDGTLVGPGQHPADVKANMIDNGLIKLWSKAPTDEELQAEEDLANGTGQNWEDDLIDAEIVPDGTFPSGSGNMVKSIETLPPEVGDVLTPEHLPVIKPGTKVKSDIAPNSDYTVNADGSITSTGGSNFSAQVFKDAVETGHMSVVSTPDYEHPEWQLPKYGELVMHKANVEKAIVALENHPHFSPKYGLKSLPDNEITKNLDDFNALAQKKYPKPIKPKQALINFLKDSIGVKHDGGDIDLLDGDGEKHTFQQKTGAKEFSTAQVQHAIKALEAAPGVQIKSILSGAKSPLAELDQHQLIGFIKDKKEQKAKYIDFLKKKIGTEDKEIDVASPAAEKALAIGDKVDQNHIAALSPEAGHLVKVDDGIPIHQVGHLSSGKTFESTGHGAWTSEDGSHKGSDVLKYMADKGVLTYAGKKGGDAVEEGTPVPDAPETPNDHPSGITKPPVGEILSKDQFFALEPGDQLENFAHATYTVAPNEKVIAPNGTVHEKLDLEHGVGLGLYSYVGKKDVDAAAVTAAGADPQVMHSKDDIAAQPVGTKFVKDGYAITKATPLSVKVTTPGSDQTYLIGTLPDSLFAGGDLKKVDEFPATHASYAWNPQAPEITNPENAPAPINGIAVGKWGTKSGKAYMVVNSDGTGTLVSATGTAKAADADKVKSVHAAGMNDYKGLVADGDYPKPDAVDAVAASAPKKVIKSVEKLPDGVYYDSSNGSSMHVVGDTVNITHNGTDSTKALSAFKAKFLKGQITDQWGNSILPKTNYGPAKLMGSDSNTVALKNLQNVLDDVLADSGQDFDSKVLSVVSSWAASAGVNIPNNKHTQVQIFLQQHGIYIPDATLAQRAQALVGNDDSLSRLKAVHATLESMLKGVEVADHPTTGAAQHFNWDALGYAKPPTSLTNLYTGQYMSNSDLVDTVKKMSADFAGGNIIGQHLGKMSKLEKFNWANAYSNGNFQVMYDLEAKAATAQGKPHASNVLHPGHPLNSDTHQIQWAAAVDGETPGNVEVPGDWSAPHLPQKNDEIDNYLIAAHMAHPEHLTLDERREWVKSHKNDQKLNVDKLSLKAEARKASGESPVSEIPKWTDELAPAKTYDVVFSQNGENPTNWSAYQAQYAVDYAKDNLADPDFKKSVNLYADELYPYAVDLAANVKNDPLYILNPTQISKMVSSHFERKLSEAHALSLIPVYELDPDFPITTQTAHKNYGVRNKNNHAQKFVFKPSPDGSAYRSEVEKLGTDLGQLFGFPSADTKMETFQGETGIMQNRHDTDFDLSKNYQLENLTDKQLGQLAQEQVLDWMINNDDAKGDNILVRKDGVVVGIDKGRAFRKYGQWKGLSTNSDDLNTNALGGTVWARLNDKIRQGKISKETASKMYFAAIQKAKRIQAADEKKIKDLLESGLQNRDTYTGKHDSSKATVMKQFFDRRATLTDDVTAMWKKLFQEAEYGDLPELPKHPLGEIHSGIHDERHHEVVLKVGVAGKSTNVVSGGVVKGGKLHSYKMKQADGGTMVQHDLQITEEAMKGKAMPFLTSTGAGPQTQPAMTEVDPVLPDFSELALKIGKGAQTVSTHAADEEYNQVSLDGLEEARKHIGDDLAFVHDGKTVGETSVHFPSGAIVDGAHIEQYVLALEHYQKQIDMVDEAKANHTKTNRDLFKAFVPQKYYAGNLAYFNALNNEKYTALANGKWLHYLDGKVSQVDNLDGIGTLDDWQKLEKPAAQAPAPTNYQINYGQAYQEGGELQNNELKLNGTTFGYDEGWDGKQYTITFDTGEKILVVDHDKTNTDWINQGRVRVQMPNVSSSGDISASWDRVTPVLEQMGISLQDATLASREADYWKLMSHIATKFDISKPMADSSVGSASKKKAAYAKVKSGIDARLKQYGMEYPAQGMTANSNFEDLDRMAKTFSSVEEEAEWYRNLYRDAWGADVIDPWVAQEKYLPKYDAVDHKHLDTETGLAYHDRFDVAEDDYKGKGRILSHKFWHHDSDAGPIGKSGFIGATQARMRLLGKWIEGWSSDADQASNSASHIFTRWTNSVGNFSGAYFPAKYGMRAESYSFNNDNCGSWNSLASLSFPDPLYLQQAQATGHAGLSSGNETVVPDVLPIWEAEFVVLETEEARTKLINELKKLGIEQIQGAPLEDRIFLRSKQASAIQKLKQKWGFKW